MKKIRKHFIFKGYVQGVGFRYKACYSARNLGIAGWVRNLDDGSVEMEAEGTVQEIETLMDMLTSHTWAEIENIWSEEIPLQGGYYFEIL